MATSIALLIVSLCLLIITIVLCRWLTWLSKRVNELENRHG